MDDCREIEKMVDIRIEEMVWVDIQGVMVRCGVLWGGGIFGLELKKCFSVTEKSVNFAGNLTEFQIWVISSPTKW